METCLCAPTRGEQTIEKLIHVQLLPYNKQILNSGVCSKELLTTMLRALDNVLPQKLLTAWYAHGRGAVQQANSLS